MQKLLFSLLILVWAHSVNTAAPLTTLQPGTFRDIQQNLTINVVFVGYEQGEGAQQINQALLQAELPGTYRTLNRNENFYGRHNYIGLTFNYNYNFLYTNAAFENAFFGYLSGIAQPKPRTFLQDDYNAQTIKTLNVGQNHWVDAPSVERWLADNADSMLGINTAQYTVFFINWYGRPDFKFHVYTKTDEPDTDTGFNFGLEYEALTLNAWGGTTPDDEENGLGSLHRIWFFDLSAGPGPINYIIDDSDVTGDGVMDYRMPPVWDYGNLSGYRPFDNLSGDLGKILRYVAIDTLFTTSPIYRPAISAPKLPGDIQLDVNIYQGDRSTNARNFFNPAVLQGEVAELQPHNNFSVEVNDQKFSGRAAEIYGCFLTYVKPPFGNNSCYGNRLFGIAFGDMFLYHKDHLQQFLEGDADYELPIFVYNNNAVDGIGVGGLGGFADDDWSSGTQSYIFEFSDPYKRAFGWGLTDTTIHEVGHHLGMSHPHDGYDYESDIDFGPDGNHYFAWWGDESNTLMSYIYLNNDFSQFDRDNMNRYITVAYINQANVILPRILGNPRAGEVNDLIAMADNLAANALTAYGKMNYAGAAVSAKAAYQNVLTAAAQINVQIEPQAWSADYRAKGVSSKFVDTVQYFRLR